MKCCVSTYVWTWTNWLIIEPDRDYSPDGGTAEPDCFLCYRISHATRNFTSGKSDVYVLIAAARRGFKMVLRPTAAASRGFTMVSFTETVSLRNTFVGGTGAPPSAYLYLYLYLPTPGVTCSAILRSKGQGQSYWGGNAIIV